MDTQKRVKFGIAYIDRCSAVSNISFKALDDDRIIETCSAPGFKIQGDLSFILLVRW
jgi:hypothetical protein